MREHDESLTSLRMFVQGDDDDDDDVTCGEDQVTVNLSGRCITHRRFIIFL